MICIEEDGEELSGGRHERGLKTLERKSSCRYHPMYYSHLHPINSVLVSTFSTLNGVLIII